jgi:alpha-N-arabinofuranosidase
MTGALEERYVFHDALAVGLYLNIFVRNSASVAMANLAQMVNAIAPIVTSPQAAVVQPIYYPFLLHAQGHLDTAVDAYVTGPTVESPAELKTRWPYPVSDLGPFPLVDVAATVDQSRRRLAVTLVNRAEQPGQVRLRLRDGALTGQARLRCLTGTGQKVQAAGITGVEESDLATGTADPRGGELVLDLPERSFTLVEADIATS